MNSFKPPLFILSAPSGAGKTTLIKQAKQIFPRLVLSVSHTTRSPREGEEHGKDYFFIDRKEFKQMVAEQKFLEWAQVHENYYGTSKSFIDQVYRDSNILVLDIDVQGAMSLKKIPTLDAVFIFIAPPSREELARRLFARGTEKTEVIETRLDNAEHELSFQSRYDYVIINADLDSAVTDFLKIVATKTTVCENDSY